MVPQAGDTSSTGTHMLVLLACMLGVVLHTGKFAIDVPDEIAITLP